ncbi:DNA excision repair protein ERCC-4 [Apostasia shenzhenica]|uniref:DNA excision repair protein ERCC-4 n=1 Tax=Apostasia shenzhenica TaxID=1088818 RepID=A0A2I0ATP5_9ASPA|nr:DNA excision repair protein ERCC-4 [Apostasia shenzhenica]
MVRRHGDPGGSGNRRSFGIQLVLALASCILVYAVFSSMLSRPMGSSPEEEDCCRGVEHLELWGAAVKWGTDHKFNTSMECCQACKSMCSGADGPCLCDSWVFCGDRERCGKKFGECWLKKQKDVMFPALQESGDKVIWTSGLIFGKGMGIIGLETKYGVINIKLFPHRAPHSVAYIVELLEARHCAGCHIYRAEGRGKAWDSLGNHVSEASFGPPYALIQGTLEAEGVPFQGIPVEACPSIKRGSVAWVGSGPEFFISLANHQEWRKSYTIFGSVLPEDMEIAERIAGLPTRSDTWNNVNVSILKKPIDLKIKLISTNSGGLNLGKNVDSGSS